MSIEQLPIKELSNEMIKFRTIQNTCVLSVGMVCSVVLCVVSPDATAPVIAALSAVTGAAAKSIYDSRRSG